MDLSNIIIGDLRSDEQHPEYACIVLYYYTYDRRDGIVKVVTAQHQGEYRPDP